MISRSWISICPTRAETQKHLLSATSHTDVHLDSHRGSILCLIAHNLVENALAAVPPGGTIRIALGKQQGMAVLTVSDNGSGIPPEICEHLFTPGRSARPGGTGLGLAISQLLARQIDASLSLITTSPTGTIFRLAHSLKDPPRTI